MTSCEVHAPPLAQSYVDPLMMSPRRCTRQMREARTAPAPVAMLATLTTPMPCARADPVVASDGNTYERHAIQAVLQSAHPRSPLTREPLYSIVFPNRALKKRIEEHDEEVIRIAERAVANCIERAADGLSSGATSSDAPRRPSRRAAPKRAAAQLSYATADGNGLKRRR